MTIGQLLAWGLPAQVAETLRRFVAEGHSEAIVVASFLHALAESPLGGSLDRNIRRRILKAWKDLGPESELDSRLQAALSGAQHDDWHWQETLEPATSG